MDFTSASGKKALLGLFVALLVLLVVVAGGLLLGATTSCTTYYGIHAPPTGSPVLTTYCTSLFIFTSNPSASSSTSSAPTYRPGVSTCP